MTLGEQPLNWSASQDRAWQMLGIGPRWVRHSSERAANPGPEVRKSPGVRDASIEAVELAQPVLFDQAALRNAINGGLAARALRWSDRSEGEQAPRTSEPRCWLLLLPTQPESPAQAGQLLDAMLDAIGAEWAKPAHSGVFDPQAAIRTLESGQVSGVLVLGDQALADLGLGGQCVNDLRGRAHQLRFGPFEIPVIVSFAPHQLLREPLDKAGAWRDLQLAKSLQTQGACFPINEIESNLA